MSIQAFIKERGILEVVHFTTHSGIVGILDSGSLIPNSELKKEKRLEFIMTLNTEYRKDPQFASYNSVSITEPNRQFFGYSRRRQVEDFWWCVLALSPTIMEHPNVLFCTGNNTWPRTIRKPGLSGLNALFDARVPGRYDTWVDRPRSRPQNVPTSLEAEFLYPGRISLDFLLRVYFEKQDHADEFTAYARTFGVALPPNCAVVNPLIFQP